MEPRCFFRWQDLIVLGVLAALLAGWFLWSRCPSQPAQPAEAEIYLGDRLMLRLPLNDGVPRQVTLPERENVHFYLDGHGGISFESSDCPDQICVHSGTLTRPGQTAACLPNQLLLRLASPEDAVDAIA